MAVRPDDLFSPPSRARTVTRTVNRVDGKAERDAKEAPSLARTIAIHFYTRTRAEVTRDIQDFFRYWCVEFVIVACLGLHMDHVVGSAAARVWGWWPW